MEGSVKTIVDNINDLIFCVELENCPYLSFLEYVSTPVGDYVKYMGHYLWDSENDYRENVFVDGEDTGEKVSLERYLLEQIWSVKHTIYNTLKIIEEN